jgi:hypothetical protein
MSRSLLISLRTFCSKNGKFNSLKWTVPCTVLQASPPKQTPSNKTHPYISILLNIIIEYTKGWKSKLSFNFSSVKTTLAMNCHFRIKSSHDWYTRPNPCSMIFTVVCIIVRCFACLWSKMPMFQRARMREGGLPLPPAFYQLILRTWRTYDLDLVMVSSLASKWQGLKVGVPVFQLFYQMKLKTSKFKVLAF